jgi:enolase
MKIKSIKAREILDSKGVPTIEVDLVTEKGKFKASVPSGVSTGKLEAVELRDGGKRYFGKGVLKAVNNINKIIKPKITERNFKDLKELDEFLIKSDGTENKSHLGANAILAVSIAAARAFAALKSLPLWKLISDISRKKPSLPRPCNLLLEGGLHGRRDLKIQEFMIFNNVPYFREQLQINTEIYHELSKILVQKYGAGSNSVGLEGAFTPPINKTKDALDLIMSAIKQAGYEGKVKIILDVAASSFYKDGKYNFEKGTLTSEKLLEFYSNLFLRYPIFAVEDPFSEEDWSGFKEIKKRFGKRITIIGDDLLVTNPERIKMALKKDACNGLILKPNQIGTVSEAIEAAKLAMKNDWKVFVKHRSGETCDTFIADLAVGLGNGFIMTGAPTRGERVAKYNRLLEIEEEINQ